MFVCSFYGHDIYASLSFTFSLPTFALHGIVLSDKVLQGCRDRAAFLAAQVAVEEGNPVPFPTNSASTPTTTLRDRYPD